MSGCEWDPKTSQPANDDHNCGNEATLCVGANGQWHLCASFSALPEFKKFRKRTPLKPRSRAGTSRDTAIRDTETGRVWVEGNKGLWMLCAGIQCDFDDSDPREDSCAALFLNREGRDALIRALGGTP